MTESAKQYINLWRDERATVDGNAPAALNSRREAAARTLEDRGFAHAGDEGYTFTDLNRMFAPDMGVNIARMPFSADVAAAFRCHVPNISTLLGVTANDVFRPTENMVRLLPEGVTVCSLSQAPELLPGVLEKYYDTTTDDDANGAVALNTLLAQDGVLVYVRKSARCDKPIQLVNILGGVNMPMLALRRLLVVMEEGSEARILACDHASDDKLHNTVNAVVEIILDKHSHLEYYDLEESSHSTRRYASINVRQQEGSHLVLNVTTLRCGVTRNDIRVSLDGPHAKATLSGIAIVDGEQLADNSATVLHHCPDCHSNQMFKYIVDGSGRGAFQGLIRVSEGAVRTDAYQTNRNILADKGARMHTQPQLEIYCDDVKCSHGAATGQIDERQLFYMQSRGIPRAEARTMLMQAFMADVIDGISLEALRDRLRHLVDQRLTGQPMNCGDCSKPAIS